VTTIFGCDCGWRVDVANGLMFQVEVRLNLTTALRHWKNGHRVVTWAPLKPLVESMARSLANRTPTRTPWEDLVDSLRRST